MGYQKNDDFSRKSKRFRKTIDGGWRDGSAVGSTDCSSRGPGFNSKYPHGNSQLSEDPVPGDLTLHSNAHKN